MSKEEIKKLEQDLIDEINIDLQNLVYKLKTKQVLITDLSPRVVKQLKELLT